MADPSRQWTFIRLRSSTPFVIFVISFAVFTDGFIYSSIIPILPFVLGDRVGIAEQDLQKWISILLAMFGITTLVGSPFIGWLADRPRYRQPVYMAGLITLAGSTLAFALGRHIWILLIGRSLQAVSTTVIWTAGLAILTDSVGPNRKGRIMGHINFVTTFGFLTGPAISGLVYDAVGYYMIYVIVGFLLALDILLRLAMLDSNTRTEVRTVPKGLGISEGRRRESNPTEDSPLLTSKTSVKRSTLPFRRLLSTRRMLIALYTVFIEVVLLISLESTLPLFIKKRLHASSSRISGFYLALTSPLILCSPIGRLADRYGVRSITAAGLAIAAPGIACLRFITSDSPAAVILLVMLLLINGLASSLIGTPAMAEISIAADEIEDAERMAGKEPKITAQAFSLMNVAIAIAQMTAPVMCGYVVEKGGWNFMTALLGGVYAASAVIVLSFAPSAKAKPRLDADDLER